MATKKEKISFYGTGRRKKSIARVRLVNGNGDIKIVRYDICKRLYFILLPGRLNIFYYTYK